MRRFWMIALAAGLALTGQAGASGSGFYLSYGAGEYTIDFDESTLDEVDFDSEQAAIGFALDSNPLGSSVFNYRMNVGIQSVRSEPVPFIEEYEGYGFELNQTFAFGVARTPVFRFWVGPALRMYYQVLEWDGRDYYYDRVNEDVYVLGIGIGPEMGFNFRTTPSMCLSAFLGYSVGGIYMDIESDSDYYYDDDSLDGSGQEGFAYLGFSMLFGRM